MNKIEEKYGLKTSQVIALLVILLLNITWIICAFNFYKGHVTFDVYAVIVLFAAVIFYALCEYKKPHGNLMRYLLLCHTLIIAVSFAYGVPSNTYVVSVFLATIILSTYMAGRLERYKQNIIISVLVLLCIIASSFYFANIYISHGVPMTFNLFMTMTKGIYVWLAIAGAYFVRYKPHKQAGLEEDKK